MLILILQNVNIVYTMSCAFLATLSCILLKRTIRINYLLLVTCYLFGRIQLNCRNTWFRNTFYVIKYTDRFYIFFHFYGILKMFHSVANKLNIEIK